jgi:hypothetical protein
MNAMKTNLPKPSLSALWRGCHDLLTSRPAPYAWFDPRPNRRIRLNLLRSGSRRTRWPVPGRRG